MCKQSRGELKRLIFGGGSGRQCTPPKDVESEIAMKVLSGVGTSNFCFRRWLSKVSLLKKEIIWVVRA